MQPQQPLPGGVAERLRERRGPDDVGEHERRGGPARAPGAGRPPRRAAARRPRRPSARRAAGARRARPAARGRRLPGRRGRAAPSPGSARARATSYGAPTSCQLRIPARSSFAPAAGSPSAISTRPAATRRRASVAGDGYCATVPAYSSTAARAPATSPAARRISTCAGSSRDTAPGVRALVLERRVDRRDRRLHLALAEPDQRERRVRRAPACVGLPERLLGALDVATQPPDLADRVEPVRLRRGRAEPLELAGSPPGGRSRPAPRRRRPRRPPRDGPGTRPGTRRRTRACSSARSPRSTRSPDGSR